MIRFVPLLLLLTCSGCIAPSDHLTFPAHAMSESATERRYDADGDQRPDFFLCADGGRIDLLEYDDDQDGTPDRRYRLSEYEPGDVPHLIILFDSIPFAPVAERFTKSSWTWFDPPVKVIPPFPTMSPVIFSRMVGGPPQAGAINQYYDRHSGERVNRLFERSVGNANAWERRLHYRLDYWENGLAFLDPRLWFRVELARAKAAFDSSPDRVTIVYFASTACMLSKYGREGLDECLDGLEQLCLQVLYERCGAVKVSMVADHGHNLVSGQRLDLPRMLSEAGYSPQDRLRSDDDVVVEQDGLVNYAGIHTHRPAQVAAALIAHKEVSLAVHMAGDRVIVHRAAGSAAIEKRSRRYRYSPVDADVFDYEPVMDELRHAGKVDADGFIDGDDWFNATVDHEWPDAPARLWEAFHGVVVNTPDVMLVSTTGYYFGLPSFDWFIDMASTHGGLNQDDSATALLTMTGRAARPLHTAEVLPLIEPTYNPSILRR